MASATEAFFYGLAKRGHEPLLEKVSGCVQIDLLRGDGDVEQWFLDIKNGDVTVSREGEEPNATFHAPAAVFEKMATGEVNAMAAILRGEVAATGNLELPLLMQRLLPGPPNSTGPRNPHRGMGTPGGDQAQPRTEWTSEGGNRPAPQLAATTGAAPADGVGDTSGRRTTGDTSGEAEAATAAEGRPS